MTNCTQFRALLPRVSSLETQLLQSIRISNRQTNCPEVLSCHDLLNMPHSSIAQCKVGCCRRQTANPRRLRPESWLLLEQAWSIHEPTSRSSASCQCDLVLQSQSVDSKEYTVKVCHSAKDTPGCHVDSYTPHARDRESSRLTFEECSTCLRKV